MLASSLVYAGLAVAASGAALAATGFLLPVSESRIARRRFATYWRLIPPGIAIIRLMWLRAIERRVVGADAPSAMHTSATPKEAPRW